MKLIVKNFSSDSHRIRVERNGMFLNATYFKKDNGKWEVDRLFFKTISPKDQYKTKLLELLMDMEDHYGIDLVRMDLKIAK